MAPTAYGPGRSNVTLVKIIIMCRMVSHLQNMAMCRAKGVVPKNIDQLNRETHHTPKPLLQQMQSRMQQ